MKTYKIYLLFGVFFSLAAVFFYFFEANNDGGQLMAPKKWKTLQVFEGYSFEIMKFMKPRNKGELSTNQKWEFENLIREIFVTIEEYPVERIEYDSIGDEELLFANTLLKLREASAQALATDKGLITKKMSPSSMLDIEGMTAAFFSMEMGGTAGVPASYHVIALYEHQGKFYLLTAATKKAFRKSYEAAFLKMIRSFKPMRVL